MRHIVAAAVVIGVHCTPVRADSYFAQTPAEKVLYEAAYKELKWVMTHLADMDKSVLDNYDCVTVTKPHLGQFDQCTLKKGKK
jgi:hypothetical protein